MKARLKTAGLAALTARPIYGLLRARALAKDPVTVLCYHTLRPDEDRLESWLAIRMSDFRKQVAFLRKHYEIVDLDSALDPEGGGDRPRLVLTFDDGERAMHDLLLPLAEDEKLPLTIYVATGQIESGRPYWFDRVMNALQGDRAIAVDPGVEGLGPWRVGPGRGAQRWAEIGAVLEALKGAPQEDRDRLTDLVAAQGGPPPDDVTPFRPMRIGELQAVAASEYVTIGAHSHGHELLDQIPLDAALESAVRSRELLARWTGRDISHFAYPNGNASPELQTGLAEAGFASATILGDGLLARDVSPMALPRIGVGRYDSLNRLKLRMVGI